MKPKRAHLSESDNCDRRAPAQRH